MSATIHAIRPNMPVLPLMTMEEVHAMKLQRRDELRHIAEQIIAEAGYIETVARTLRDNAKLVHEALMDCEAELSVFGDSFRNNAKMAQDSGECG